MLDNGVFEAISRNTRFSPYSRAYYAPAYDGIFLNSVTPDQEFESLVADVALESGHRLVNQFTGTGRLVFELEALGTNLVQYRDSSPDSNETLVSLLRGLDMIIKETLSSYEVLDETFSMLWASVVLQEAKRWVTVRRLEDSFFKTYPSCKVAYLRARKLADAAGRDMFYLYQLAANVLPRWLLDGKQWNGRIGGDYPDKALRRLLKHSGDSKGSYKAERMDATNFLHSANPSKEFSDHIHASGAKMELLHESIRREFSKVSDFYDDDYPLVAPSPEKMGSTICLAVKRGKIVLLVDPKREKMLNPRAESAWIQHCLYTIVKNAILDGQVKCPLKAFVGGCNAECEHLKLMVTLSNLFK